MKLNNPKRSSIRLFAIVLLMTHLNLFSQKPDTSDLSLSRHRQTWITTLAVPSVLVGCGLLTMDNNQSFYNSYNAYEDIQKRWPDFSTRIDDYLGSVPVLAVYGLNLAGIKGNNSFIDRSLIYLIAYSASTFSYRTIKRETHILRPDSSDFRSFPSGHTTLAFVSATFLFEEYKDRSIWYGMAGYSFAIATGIIRMLNNKHWMSDVFVGAGLGIFITELTYLAYPYIKDFVNTKILSRRLDKVEILPSFSSDRIGLYICLRIN